MAAEGARTGNERRNEHGANHLVVFDHVHLSIIWEAEGKKANMRPTTSETRSYWQFRSDPDPKKSGWTLQQDIIYIYEIKDNDHNGSRKEKSSGERKKCNRG